MTSTGASPPCSDSGSCFMQDSTSDRHLRPAGRIQNEEQFDVGNYTGGDMNRLDTISRAKSGSIQLMSLLVLSAPAIAQQAENASTASPETLEQITVTATRREESVQN